jgi:hypothetical protein
MALINQLKGLIEAQGKTISRQGVAIARHESALIDLEPGDQSITSNLDQSATKRACNEDGCDNPLLIKARQLVRSYSQRFLSTLLQIGIFGNVPSLKDNYVIANHYNSLYYSS